ncbi:hypothetical protein BU17DRAFT_57658 [Hysterangium stoloniferum]|nr:hypothetical protein BU17DRAFT_57658 [Hysterangium stoloniferum]
MRHPGHLGPWLLWSLLPTFPDLPTSCPCGTEDIQSHLHILSKCPLHEEHCLCTASQEISLPIILGTHKGLEALAEFIATSDAFWKA